MPNTTYGTPFVASSDLVSAYPGVSSNLATRLDQVSYAGNGLNNITSTSYTLVLTDVGKTVTLSNASAVAVTIPSNASVAAPLGSMIRFCNLGAGTVTIQPTGGVTLNGGNLTLAQFAAVQIVKLATDTWGVVDSVGATPGLIQVTPSSITNSGGSATLTGNAVSFNAVNSISLNGVFSATYDNYRVVLYTTTNTSSTFLNFRWRAAGSDRTGSVYCWAVLSYKSNNVIVGDTANENAAQAYLTSTLVASVPHSFAMDAYTPFVSTTESGLTLNGRVQSTGTSFLNSLTGAVAYRTADQNDGFTLYPSAGTMTGVVRVYGYRN